MSRYVAARHYISFGIVALALAGFSGWLGLSWTPAFCPALLFLVTAGMLLGLATRPEIKVYDAHLEIGKRIIPWQDVRAVDRTGWISPLIVKLSLYDDETIRARSIRAKSIAASICCARCGKWPTGAMIDGVPYRQYWGELLGSSEARRDGSPALPRAAPGR